MANQGSIIEMPAFLKGIALWGRTPGLTLPVSIDQPGTMSFGHGTFIFFLNLFLCRNLLLNSGAVA